MEMKFISKEAESLYHDIVRKSKVVDDEYVVPEGNGYFQYEYSHEQLSADYPDGRREIFDFLVDGPYFQVPEETENLEELFLPQKAKVRTFDWESFQRSLKAFLGLDELEEDEVIYMLPGCLEEIKRLLCEVEKDFPTLLEKMENYCLYD